jgi:ABC-type dipeptide/oligopeptide/nickel transport system permease subunit
MAQTDRTAYSRERRGPWGNLGHRLLRKPRAVFGMAILLLFALVAIAAPWVAPHDPLKFGVGQQYLPPAWVSRSLIGRAGDPSFLLGTDVEGRDLFSRLLYGTRASMFVVLAATPFVTIAGASVGLIAGYRGGRIDNLMMRATDVFYAFPNIMLYIMIMIILRRTAIGQWQNGLLMLLLALVAIGWVDLARLVRGQTLVLKSAEYVQAARCVGASDRRIIMRHILPNCLPTAVVWLTSAIPRMILVEAILGYVGVGINASGGSDESFLVTSWGGLFLEGRLAINAHPVILIAPAVCVALVGVAFAFLGDGLRDAIDPQMREL